MLTLLGALSRHRDATITKKKNNNNNNINNNDAHFYHVLFCSFNSVLFHFCSNLHRMLVSSTTR